MDHRANRQLSRRPRPNATASATNAGVRAESWFYAGMEVEDATTNRIAELGTFQLINTGSGTVEGFGAATVVVGITQDRSVTPCGPGSWTNAATRRIVLEEGVLVLRELAIRCPTASGPDITGTYEVDGLSSTGIFAGARGTGNDTVDTVTHTSTLSGKLKLAGQQ